MYIQGGKAGTNTFWSIFYGLNSVSDMLKAVSNSSEWLISEGRAVIIRPVSLHHITSSLLTMALAEGIFAAS